MTTPVLANQWAAEGNVSLNGTRISYYPDPSQGRCLATCNANGQCQGATWIQAGTYNPGDSAMCYLFSAVTARVTARGHVSMVKSAPVNTGQVPAEGNVSLNGTRLTYYPDASQSSCLSTCQNNGQCQGATWIQAGTYNAGDSAMCYLLSSVTARVPARGHFSMVKGVQAPPPSVVTPPPIVVSPPPNLASDFDVQKLGSGSIRVLWSGKPGAPRDWVSVVPVGMADSAHAGKWRYAPTPAGSTDFGPLAAGSYEARFYLNDTYVVNRRAKFNIP